MTDKLVMLGQLIADAAHSGPVDYETGTTIAAPLAGWVDVDITGVGVVGVLVPLR